MRKQAGFTIIELVVVIILLGIMAATALPRFMNVTDEAHAAVVDGVRGGLASGVAMFHGQWIAEGQKGPGTTITEFGSLRPNPDGYPYGTTDRSGGTKTVTDSTDCVAIFSNILQAGAPTIAVVADAASVTANTSTDEFLTHTVGTSNCEFYYIARTTVATEKIQKITYNSSTGAVIQSLVTL